MANMSEPPVSLEDLLKLKRHERPQGEFWDSFERDFQRRRLRALMEGGEPRLMSAGFWWRLVKWSPITAGAVAVLAVFVSPISLSVMDPDFEDNALVAGMDVMPPVAATALSEGGAQRTVEAQPSPERGTPYVASLSTPLQSRFIRDELATQEEPRNFRRVLSSASLSVPAAVGSRYVADPLTTGRMEATSVVMRPRSHF